MYTLVIGRAYPAQETGMMGIFEFEQAIALNKHGMNTVYAFCDTRSIKRLRKLNYKTFTEKGVPVYGYHFPIGGLPRKIFDMLKLNRYKKLIRTIIKVHGVPAYIHVHFPLLTLNKEIWSLLRKLDVPIVVTEHWSRVHDKSIEDYRIDLLKHIVEEAKEFICVSEPLKNSVLELTNSTRTIRVIPNMVNEHFYYEEAANTNHNEFYFIAIGRMTETKRFSFLVKAFAQAFPNQEDVKLRIVGDGPLYEEVKTKIKQLNLENRVKMYGFLPREQTANLLRRSDAFVSASIIETFGVPFIEAMACGKPVIGIKGCPIEPYINSNNGKLFDKDSLSSLVTTCQKLYRNINKYSGEQTAANATNNFSEKAIANRLLKVYTEY